MTQYDLTYQPSVDLLNRAMVAWARPQRRTREKLLRVALGVALYLMIVAAIVVLLRYDIVTNQMLVGFMAGLLLSVAIWAFCYRMNVKKVAEFSHKAMERHSVTTAKFHAGGVELKSEISNASMGWLCFDDLTPLADGTVLRAGGVVYPVPDAALPANVTPAQFRADLQRWLEAAR